MGPDSIMAFFTSKLANPTTLSKLRPQLAGAFLALIVVTLLALVPFLSFMWHVSIVLGFFFAAVDSVALKDKACAYFIRIAIFFFVRVPGLKVHLYGDFEEIRRRDENVLYMCNHQSSLDWILASVCATYSGALDRAKFIMKQELHWMPMLGYYMKAIGHIYVRRRGFQQDKLMESLAVINEMKRPFWFIVYPEGTRFNPDDPQAVAASVEFAKQYNNGLVLKHQLTPRPKGTMLMIKNMRSKMSAVYTVTTIFENFEPKGLSRKAPTATEVLGGACTDVHLYIKRIPIEQVPEDDADFAPWLFAQCEERDRRMSEYFATKSFAPWGPSVVAEGGSMLVDVACLGLMTLSLVTSPLVRTVYLTQALLGTLYSYAALFVKPCF